MIIHAIRLVPGDDLKSSLESFVKERKILAGAVVTCVGSLKRSELRMANAVETTVRDEKFEIVSLVGTLGTEGCHLHISLSDKKGNVTGGHLMKGNIVYTTAELVIGELPGLTFSRYDDERTGFKELQINTR